MINPFATRYTRPGALDFILPPGESVAALVGKLRQQGWWGQIIGPHGSGKSTLLASLTPALEAAGRRVLRETVHSGQRSVALPGDLAQDAMLMIDGYEQLSWFARWRVKSFCRRRRAGLLITAHADAGLPTLFCTEPSLALAEQLVTRLLPAEDATITPADIAAAHSAHPGNLREMLFALFDLYQHRSVKENASG